MRKPLLIAAFLLLSIAQPARAQFCPGVSPWVFDDVPASDPFCGYITWMAQNGVSLGCQIIDANHRLYCPTGNVSRSQMAAFMSRLGDGAVFKQGGNAYGATAKLGTNDLNPLEIRVNGAKAMRYEPGVASPNVVGGPPANLAGPYEGQTLAGGGNGASNCYNPANDLFTKSCSNVVYGDYATVGGGVANGAQDRSAVVGGGESNTASGLASTVAGGRYSSAIAIASTVGGGQQNQATGAYAVVAGGYKNTASGIVTATVGGGAGNSAQGQSSTVPGGEFNVAAGYASFAAGTRAKATHDRSFVWGGSDTVDTNSNAAGVFTVYAPTSVQMYAGPLGSGGCILTSGASGWACSSDRALKSDVTPVDAKSMLDRVLGLPVATWSFATVPGVIHVGPMAQDFHAAFGLGDDPRMLAPMDVQGVSLAAIQGLNAKLEAQLKERDAQIAELRRLVEVLLARTSPEGRVAAK